MGKEGNEIEVQLREKESKKGMMMMMMMMKSSGVVEEWKGGPCGLRLYRKEREWVGVVCKFNDDFMSARPVISIMTFAPKIIPPTSFLTPLYSLPLTIW